MMRRTTIGRMAAVGGGTRTAAGSARCGAILSTAGLVLALAGCGNITSGGFGEVEVVLTSDEIGDLQTAARASTMASALGSSTAPSVGSGSAHTSHLPEIEGTLTVRLRTFAQSSLGEAIELTDGVKEVTLSLSDPSPTELARREIPAGRYRGLRTVFGRIEATITGGLVVDGVEVTGTVPVRLGLGDTLSVVSLTGFDVYEDAPTELALEMQSRIWLRLVDATLRRVDLEDFRRIFRIRVRLRG